MNSEQIPTMQDLLKALPTAEKAVSEAETLLRTLLLENGQATAACSVGGLRLPLTYENRETGYMPRKVPGRQALLALLQREAHDHLIACRSKVEGLQFQIRKLAGSPS